MIVSKITLKYIVCVHTCIGDAWGLCACEHAYACECAHVRAPTHVHVSLMSLISQSLQQYHISVHMCIWVQTVDLDNTDIKLQCILTKKMELNTKSMNIAHIAPYDTAIVITYCWQYCRKARNPGKCRVNVTAQYKCITP